MSDAEDLARDYVRKELETAEKIGELVRNYNDQEVKVAMKNVVEQIVPAIEDPFREQQVYRVLIGVGQAISDEDMVKEGQRKLQEWKEEHS